MKRASISACGCSSTAREDARYEYNGRGQLSSYLGEFRWHWPTILGAALGLALGSALNHYMLNLFGPPLIAEFGWTKAQFALVSSLSLVTLVFVPFAGRFVDHFGARTAATVGFAVVPLSYLVFSFMSGNILEFYAITAVSHIFGVLTTSLVFCRVVVERFDAARGMALSVAMSCPPLIGAIAVPIVGEVVDHEGWRAGYRVLAAMSAAGGVAAIVLIGLRKPVQRDAAESPAKPQKASLSRQDMLAILRQPTFLLLIGGMFLVNAPQVIVSSQMKLVLYESGATSTFATWLVSLYAISVIIGRFISGYALDRVPPHVVAVVSLGLPAMGLFALASPFDMSWVLIGAIALTGLAQGAEGDIGAIITSRKFDMRHYSFVYSFVIAAIGGAAAVGSVILSAMLHRTDSYDGFLVFSGLVTLLGVACFWFIGGRGCTRLPEPRMATAQST